MNRSGMDAMDGSMNFKNKVLSNLCGQSETDNQLLDNLTRSGLKQFVAELSKRKADAWKTLSCFALEATTACLFP